VGEAKVSPAGGDLEGAICLVPRNDIAHLTQLSRQQKEKNKH